MQHVGFHIVFDQRGGHNAEAFLTVNNIRTSAAAYRIFSSEIDRFCKHAMLELEAAVIVAPMVLSLDLVPLTSRVALLAVLTLMPSRRYEQGVYKGFSSVNDVHQCAVKELYI